MSNLFCVSSVLHLTFAQLIAQKKKSRGEKNYLLLYHMKSLGDIEESFKQLLVEDLWEEHFFFNLKAYGLHLSWPYISNPFESHRRLYNAEKLLDSYLSSISQHRSTFIFNPISPIDRYLWLWSTEKKRRVHYVEDGLAIYMDEYYRSPIHWTDISIKGYIARIASSIFLRSTKRDPFIFLPGKRVFDRRLHFDSAYVTFPSKFPHVETTNKIIPLGDYISERSLRDLTSHLDWQALIGEETLLDKVECIYLSRPDAEDNSMSEGDQINLTSQVLTYLCSRYRSVMIKPHPRERRSKVAEILRKNPRVTYFNSKYPLPIELISTKLDIDACYGTWTSSLIYLSEFTGKRTYSLLPFFLERQKEKGEEVRQLERIYNQLRNKFENEVKWIDVLNGTETSDP